MAVECGRLAFEVRRNSRGRERTAWRRHGFARWARRFSADKIIVLAAEAYPHLAAKHQPGDDAAQSGHVMGGYIRRGEYESPGLALVAENRC